MFLSSSETQTLFIKCIYLRQWLSEVTFKKKKKVKRSCIIFALSGTFYT